MEEHPMMSMVLKLKTVEAHDPWEAQHVLVAGDAWLKKYWNETGSSGKWRNCYVAVHEVEARSKASLANATIVTDPHPTQGTYLSSEKALQKAKEHLVRITEERRSFNGLANAKLFEPMLVEHEEGDYYLIPIGKEQNGTSLGALMVNAYSGAWEGISQFQKPIRYRSQRQAGRWLFQPSEESRSPFHPVYQTATNYIDFNGKSSQQLHALGLGN
ncbi:MAG: hypothetical protein R3B54_16100 [Bdellovibrionota bacterium]